jgi:sphingosine-1-phosphate phosphatase 2
MLIPNIFSMTHANAIGLEDGPLISLFLLISKLGDQSFYLVIVPIVYWCYRKGFGTELIAMLLTTYYVSLTVKEWLKIPRPPSDEWIEGSNPVSYSFPSGHAQGCMSFWVYVGAHVRRYWAVILGTLWILLVSISRLMLGVHRWEDIVGGWVVGAIIAIVFIAFRGPMSAAFGRLDHFQRLSLAVAIPIILFLFMKTVLMAQLCGFMLGALSGAEIETNGYGMPDCTDGRQRLRRAAIGFPLCGLLLFGLGGLGTDIPGWQFVVYSLSGMGVTLFAPVVFSIVEGQDDRMDARTPKKDVDGHRRTRPRAR